MPSNPHPAAPNAGRVDPLTFWRRSAVAAGAVSLIALGALGGTLWHEHATSQSPAAAADVAPVVADAPVAGPPAKPAPAPAVRPHTTRPGATTPQARTSAETQSTPLATQPAVLPAPPVCTNCGVVESVTAVSHKGQGSGLGAVAGGLLGGVVGHQMGGGSGRKALTVLGAIGGGLAGNEIEKRQKSTTDYRVSLRMADGSMRTVTSAHAPNVGEAVRIEADGRLVPDPATPRSAAPAAGDGEVRTLQTAARH
jgi:outer membrane lipoprotein SlyB